MQTPHPRCDLTIQNSIELKRRGNVIVNRSHSMQCYSLYKKLLAGSITPSQWVNQRNSDLHNFGIKLSQGFEIWDEDIQLGFLHYSVALILALRDLATGRDTFSSLSGFLAQWNQIGERQGCQDLVLISLEMSFSPTPENCCFHSGPFTEPPQVISYLLSLSLSLSLIVSYFAR